MGMTGAQRWGRGAADATRRAAAATRRAAAASRRGTSATGRFVHRITGAQGAGRTGLATLIEMTATSGAADAFVTVALGGTIFFSTSVDQARGRVVLFLLITMAPFAVLAPFLGPALDRFQQGRRFVLAGTMMARGLLCYAMAANVADSVTLLPAAFGILVLQKAGGVIKASVTPRLLPGEITLVTANARSGLISLAASTAAAGVAAGVLYVAGAAWTLRVATLVYLAAMILALRLPEYIDVPAPAPDNSAPAPHPAEGRGPSGTLPLETPALRPAQDGPGQNGPNRAHGNGPHGNGPHGIGRWRTLASVGPVVSEAMAVNAVLRAFSGYILFMLAFLLRSLNFGAPHHYVSHNFALAALAAGLSAGSLVSMLLGSFLRSRAPQLIMFTVLAIAPVVAVLCAWSFGLWAAAAVMFAAIFCASLAKLGQDSIVQREIGDEIRTSTFSVSETLNQVANVAGGLAGVLVSMLNNGQAGLAIGAAGLFAALVILVARRRRRVRLGTANTPSAHAASTAG